MSENNSNPGEEILEAGFAAMRGRAVPDGPAEMRIAETIAAIQAAAERGPNIFSRMNHMKFITGMAASVLLVVGAVVVGIVMLRSPEVTCAEVVDVVRKAHTLSFVTTTAATAKIPSVKIKTLVNGQGQMCMEMGGGMRTVMDMRTGHVLVEEPMTKTAIVMDMKNMPKQAHAPDEMIESFKKLQGDSAKDLGRTEIDGKKAEKFSATQDGADYVVWADPQTREPIRVDVTTAPLDQKMVVSMTDFEFNSPIPEDMFSEEVPKGYTVQKLTLDLPDMDNGEQNVVDLLREYAQRSDGKFPPKVDDMAPFMNLLVKHATTRSSQLDQADMQLIVQVQAVKHFLGKLLKGQWEYDGDGKVMGDGKALIFWYKSAREYRGIFGDLSAKDLPSAPR